ncbi:hypothetical protein B0H10DRAFT_2428881 [Mycena sp. CBHHK59/15]|nr:hypothetical protein B0H10DRAFT_2428881 [Mycena sp. CBHHK59/15]
MSDTFVEPNIDPTLLAMDPASQMLQKMRAKRASASAPGTPPPRDDDATAGGNDSMDQDLPPGPSSFTPGPSSFALAPSSLATFGNLVKHQIKLSDKSAVEFDRFLQAKERNMVLFAHVLVLRDITRMNERPDKWVISPDLLRPTAERTHSGEGTKIKATLQLYIRLATIRFVMVNYPVFVGTDAFWLKVDDVLDKNSKQSAMQAELDVLYNCYYDDDMAEYGDPAKTAHQTVESNETDTTSWQGIMRKHSVNVLPNPNLEKLLLQALAAVATVQSTLKRKHPTEEEPEMAQQIYTFYIITCNKFVLLKPFRSP